MSSSRAPTHRSSSSTLAGAHPDMPVPKQPSKRPWRKHITPADRLAHERWEGEGTEEKPYVVGWMTGDMDPENPRTWKRDEKWSITMIAAFMTLVVSLTSSIYSGAIGSIQIKFPGYSIDTYISPLSTFVLGFAIGPLLWAPLSEVFGRRNIFIVTYACFTLFNAGLCASQNIWTVAILRFFSGAFGSSPLTNAGGVISDIWDPEALGEAMAVFSVAPYLGPAMGPIIGGFLGESASFRWVFALVAILTAIITVAIVLFLPETYAPVLLRERANRLTEVTGKVHRSEFEKDEPLQFGSLMRKSLIRPWQLLFLEPIVLLLSIYLAIIYGTLYMLFAAFPIVYEQQRGWSAGVGALPFLGPLVGFLVAVAGYTFIENKRYIRVSHAHGGYAPPEQRLPSALIGGVLLPVGLFWFAWTAAPTKIPWIVSVIATVPFGIGMVLVFLSVLVYLVDAYLIYAASVLAANSVLRSLFGAAFPLFTTQMYENLGINWASTLVAFLALACAPLPFLFFRYGEKIRLRSKYAKEAAKIAAMIKERAQKQQELEKRGEAGSETA